MADAEDDEECFVFPDSDEADDLSEAGRNKSTKRATVFALHLLEDFYTRYCETKQLTKAPLLSLSVSTLDRLLTKFWTGVRRRDGTPYQAESLRPINSGIMRYLRDNRYGAASAEDEPINIITDMRFNHSRQARVAREKALTLAGYAICQPQGIRRLGQ